MKYMLAHFIRIPSRRFFENYYLLFFGAFLIGIIFFSGIVFILSTKKEESQQKIFTAEGTLNESIIFNITKLLDLREEYFNKLRTTKPVMKNPF